MNSRTRYALAVTINQVLIVLAVLGISLLAGFGWNPLLVLAFGVVGFWLWNTLVSAAIRGYIYATSPQVVVNNSKDIDDLIRDASDGAA